MHFLKTILLLSFITTSWASHAASPDTNKKPKKFCFNLLQQGVGLVTVATLHLTANSMGDNFYTIFGTYDLPHNRYREPLAGSAVVAEDKDTLLVTLPMRNGSLSLELSLKAGLEGSYEKTNHQKTNKYYNFYSTDPFDNLDSWDIFDMSPVIRAVSVVQGGTVKRCELTN